MYPFPTIQKFDEIPPMSQEWQLRAAGLHKEANRCGGPTWLDFAATREEKAFWHGDWL